MSCTVTCRHGSDPALLWLWYRLVAAALIQPLAWELAYAMGVTLKRFVMYKCKDNLIPLLYSGKIKKSAFHFFTYALF